MDRHGASRLAMTRFILMPCCDDDHKPLSSLRGGFQADATIHLSTRIMPLILRSDAARIVAPHHEGLIVMLRIKRF